MKLVDDFREAWTWFSMQANALNVALLVTWTKLPDELKASIPHEYVVYGSMALLVLGTVGRLIDQGKK